MKKKDENLENVPVWKMKVARAETGQRGEFGAMNHSASVSPRRLSLLFVTFLTLPVLPVAALAQDSPLPDNIVVDEDGSRFGRLRYLEGEVLVEGMAGARGGETLETNVPVMAGDRLKVGRCVR